MASHIRKTLFGLSLEGVATLTKEAQRRAIDAALTDDEETMIRCEEIATIGEAHILERSCMTEPPRYAR